jgi:hypothetical protein
MTVLINNGAALGNMYMVLYNKENYIQNTENTDVQDVLEENISENVEDTLCFISNLKVEVSIENTKGNNVIGNTESILKGKVYFDKSNYGIAAFGQNKVTGYTYCGQEEIRDTADNLRRWQLYGEVLSE